MKNDLYEEIEKRRSYYVIGKEPIISDGEIIELLKHAVKFVPSAYNSQSSRMIVLLGKEHEKFWEFTKEILKPGIPPEKFSSTEQKLDAFKSGYGTILFFEDQSVVKGLQEKFPKYKENFALWSLQSSGMLQYTVWLTLESEGYGASLQHYNPLVDEKVRSVWNAPDNWKLLAQMPFGNPIEIPDEKSFLPIEERIRVFK